jgi:hypothetical protein
MVLAAAAAVVGLICWGGFTTKHYYRCSVLEDDFLNSMSSMKGSTAVRIIASGDPELTRMADERDKLDQEQSERTLRAIYLECGERAGHTAVRKASELIRF